MLPNGTTRTYPPSAETHAQVFDSIDTSYRSVNPIVADDATEAPPGAPKFPETEETLCVRCSTTLDKLLELAAHQEDGGGDDDENIAIVSHAPCDIAMALHLTGSSLQESTSLEAWPLGGLTLFSRPIFHHDDEEDDDQQKTTTTTYGAWTMELYGSSDHMPGEYKVGIKRWTLPSLAK